MEETQSALPGVSSDESVVNVDLCVTSTESLRNAVETITRAINLRKERAVCPKQHELLDRQLIHIERELAGQLDTDMKNTAVPLSLEHLELYQAFLGRQTFDDVGDVDEMESLIKRHQELVKQVGDMLDNHPLKGIPRSGNHQNQKYGHAFFKVPIGRRRQVAAMLYLNLLTGPTLIFFTIFLMYYFIPHFQYLFLLYIGYVTFDNFTRPSFTPDRVKQWWRHTPLYGLFRDFFPLRIIKAKQTAVYDGTKKNFLFCYHPHGVQSSGAFSFASAAAGFDHLFPGLTAHVQTLSINFCIPFTRENLLALGVGDASKDCLTKCLTHTPGTSAVLVTGGALESMYSHPHKSKVVLKTRAGFIKVALRTGASLVPVWGFGENNMYENLAQHNPHLRSWQRRIQRIITFAPLLVHGRGVFTYSGGLLPHRTPISVVVGEPIHLEQDSEPTPERIQEVHAEYKAALLDLFNTYKDIYDPKAEPIEYI